MSDTIGDGVTNVGAIGVLSADGQQPQGADISLNLANIQGNILGPFNKDFQDFLFLQFTNSAQAKAWAKGIVDDIATSEEVIAFNKLFKATKARRHGQEGTVKATWMNIAFTQSGLKALGASDADLNTFPEDFKAGMASRAQLIGDVGANDPKNWIEPFKSGNIDAVMIIASDSLDDLTREVARQTSLFGQGVHLAFTQEGRTRTDSPGHEHFGFKDGISQPGIRGVDTPDSSNPDESGPGTKLIWPGEFVLGYLQQSGTDVESAGNPSANGPDWTRDGSYLVFRRLRQDVKAFRDFVAQQAAKEGISPDVMGAKLVGRYKSGTPLERTKNEPTTVDTTKGDRKLDAVEINDFQYGNDPDGQIVPRAAHIRKTYPRDQDIPGEAFTQTRRLLRRGIPFGVSFQDNAPAGSPAAGNAAFPHDRGLLFLAYQNSISDHFEFLQQAWVNAPDFPQSADGHDVVISEAEDKRNFSLPGGKNTPITGISQWVTTTGGAYFFQPSIDALKKLVGE